jgi:antitoxin component of RelBE/YafQ-DinJ toxin-antitoxin module
MSFSTGINIYLEQVVLKKGIPFALKAAGAKKKREEEPSRKKVSPQPGKEKAGVSESELSLSEILNGLKDDDSPKKKKRKITKKEDKEKWRNFSAHFLLRSLLV